MKVFKSVPFVDFSLGKGFTLEEVSSSCAAARDDINLQLREAGIDPDKDRTAWSEEFDSTVGKKRKVVKLIESQQESYEVFADQYAYND